jgi:hypothetical protein
MTDNDSISLEAMASAMASAALTEEHEKNVRPWIDLIDSMRALGVHEDLPLPQVTP